MSTRETKRETKRESKRESKKEHILSAGTEVMKLHGYNGTSVKDIVDAAGVPKGSFYNYFVSKEAFAVEALQTAAAEDYQVNSKILGNSQRQPLQRLHDYFVHHTQISCDNEFRTGCFLGNLCQEMADSSSAIRHAVDQMLANNTRQLAAVLQEAQRNNDISVDVDVDATAEFLFNAWQGALLRMKATKGQQPLDVFLATFPHFLHP